MRSFWYKVGPGEFIKQGSVIKFEAFPLKMLVKQKNRAEFNTKAWAPDSLKSTAGEGGLEQDKCENQIFTLLAKKFTGMCAKLGKANSCKCSYWLRLEADKFVTFFVFSPSPPPRKCGRVWRSRHTRSKVISFQNGSQTSVRRSSFFFARPGLGRFFLDAASRES